jgi:hypothetical protein
VLRINLLFLSILSFGILTRAEAATLSSYEIKPTVIQAAVSTPLKLIAHYTDAPDQDVSSQFSFSYLDSDPTVKEVSIVPAGSNYSVFGSVVGSGYQIQAVNKLDSSITASGSLSVTAGSASKLSLVSGNTQSATAGSSLTNPLVVKVLDKMGNAVPNYSINWSSSSNGSFSPSSSLSNSNGLSSTTYTVGSTAGSETVTATTSSPVSGLGSVSFSVTAKNGAGTATKLVFDTQPGSAAVASTAFTTSPTVSVRDSANGVIASTTYGIQLTPYLNSACTTPATGTLGGTAYGVASGSFSFSSLSYSQPETIYLKATSGSLTSACSS